MCDSIRRFKTNCVLFFVLIYLAVSRSTNTSTVCYGSSGLSCTTHKLSCPSSLVIQILNTSYGYRAGCNDVNGLTSCTNTACCHEEPSDCFIPFSSEEYQQVKRKCSGVESCELTGLHRYNNTVTVCNGRKVSAYSKIQYDCVSNGLTIIAPTAEMSTSEVTQSSEDKTSKTQYSTTTQYSTDLTTSTTSTLQCLQAQNDNLGIVGGVLGSLLIISVIINVGLVVYITRKMKSLSSTPRENNYDGLTNIGRDQTPTTYDALQVQSAASSDHDDKKISDSNHTYYNTKGDSLSRDVNPYLEVF